MSKWTFSLILTGLVPLNLVKTFFSALMTFDIAESRNVATAAKYQYFAVPATSSHIKRYYGNRLKNVFKI
jgi:hypothetical protein